MKFFLLFITLFYYTLTFAQDTLTVPGNIMSDTTMTPLVVDTISAIETDTIPAWVTDTTNSAPSFKKKRPTQFIELGISPNSYKGDLVSSYRQFTSSVHLGFQMNIKKKLNGHLNIFHGYIAGSNDNYTFTGSSQTPPTPNTFFRTTFTGFEYDLHVNFYKTDRFCFYLSQGIGLMKFKPQNDNEENFDNLLSTRAKGESYSTTTLVLPTFAGGYFLLPNSYGLGFQAGFLNTKTDYLDNIGQWGNRKKKDQILMYKVYVLIPVMFE